MRFTSVFAVLLVVATVIVYQDSLRDQFINYDDPAYVTKNIHVLQGLSWSNPAWAFTSTAEANWHPITWLSHMADVQFFGLNPLGHHFTNLLLHLCNVLLVFFLLRAATPSVFCSGVVAVLFAIHPLNVETVAWVAERKSLLSMFSCFWRSGRGRDTFVGAQKVVTSSYASFSHSPLMSKPMGITFPLLLLLVDYWPH